MSGTSLDGLDIIYCVFHKKKSDWKFEIIVAETIPYKDSLKNKLKNALQLSGMEVMQLDAELGHQMGLNIISFIKKNKLQPDFISSHGHTLYHQPEKRMTAQIGSGAAIAAETKVNVICDFRSTDVALGGQGAPLVPIGDQLLFAEYDGCLNLGGISNISLQKNKQRIAWDICPVNMLLNYLAEKAGKKFDKNGHLAAKGTCIDSLLNKINQLEYYKNTPPKTLGYEWFAQHVLPLFSGDTHNPNDLLRTASEHIAFQIASTINTYKLKNVIVTGGGAQNTFLIQRINSMIKAPLIIPDPILINFKEALIFAFLGVLRIREEISILKSVTGAKTNSIGGAIYLGKF